MLKVSDNPTTMRLSIIGYLIEAIAIVLLALLLYGALNGRGKTIARWALGLWLVQAVILAVRETSLLSLLNVSCGFAKAGAPSSSHFQTLGSLFYEAFQFGYDVQMVFYCTGGVLFYYLFLKSGYIPAVLSIWGIAAASVALVGTVFALFGNGVPLYVFLPVLPFELAIAVWLMVRGFSPSAIASGSAGVDMNRV
jgi:hypothetical protein